MVKRGRVNAEIATNLVPMLLGVVLVLVGAINGSRRNLLIGVALACTGIAAIIGPRLLPPMPGLSAERLGARRAAVTLLPNGIIFLALGVLLIVATPERERGGVTTIILLFAFVMGVFSTLSGLGAVVRAHRPDDPPPAKDAHQERA